MSQKPSWITWVAGVSATVGMLITAGVAYAVVPTLSQPSITIGMGQSMSVTSGNGISVYMGSNSNPTVVSVSVNGTQITLTGQSLGSAGITICAVGTSSDCTNLAVTVQAGSVSGISFSQSNLSLAIGSNQSVTVSGGNRTYAISSNSNTSVAATSLSGATLTVSGLAAGGATINVCDTSGTCGTLSVTINSSGTSGLSFSQNNLSLSAGGSQVVTISGGNGTYNISNNSNASVVSAGMSNNGITVYAVAAGTATIKVCDTSGTICGTLSVTVTAPTANQAVTFSVTNPTLTVGQSLNVGLSGGASSYVVLSNTNANVVQASINNSITLSLYGASAGTDSLTICATAGGCSPFPVVVTGSSPNTVSTPTTTATPTPVQTAAPTAQSGAVVVNTALLAEIQSLQTAVAQILTQVTTQIQSIQTQLNQLEAQVNAGSGSGISTSASAAVTNTFTELLTVGSNDAQVTALQRQLTVLGFYSGPITGYFGTLTGQAVMKYQTAHGIAASGYVDPSTRTALNAGN
jgi:hypothetical protein